MKKGRLARDWLKDMTFASQTHRRWNALFINQGNCVFSTSKSVNPLVNINLGVHTANVSTSLGSRSRNVVASNAKITATSFLRLKSESVNIKVVIQ